jgi:fructokinase
VNPRIGVDLGGTKIEGVVLETDDSVSAALRLPTPRNDYAGTLAAVAELVTTLDESRGLQVGIGTPGSWLAEAGRMQNCNSTWLNGRPLLTDLQQALGPRVRLANDADCFALSEACSGSAADATVVLGVILGTGVGGGVVVERKLLVGPNGLTGEWGHTPMPYLSEPLASRQCYCGRVNCIETFLSGPGLFATHAELWPDELAPPADAAGIYLAAELASAPADWVVDDSDDASTRARARRTLSVYCAMLGRSLAQMVNILDPHAIVLGGGLSQMREIYQPVREFMAAAVFGERCETRLLAPRWGDASGVRGAARLWE